MSYIKKDSQIVINAKLTNVGRFLLASGKLKFAKFALGDSEVDYAFAKKYGLSLTDKKILKPAAEQTGIKHILNPETDVAEKRIPLGSPIPTPTYVDNVMEARGFFTGNDTDGYMLKTTPEFVKAVGTLQKGTVNGGKALSLTQSISVEEGDYVLVAWKNPDGSLLYNREGFIDKFAPAQYIWYKAMSVSGTTITVDKSIPDFGSGTQEGDCYAYVFPKGEATDYYYSDPQSHDFEAGVWNLTMYHSQSMTGADDLMRASGYPSADYAGIGKYLGVDNRVVGMVHYSNYGRLNTYGESFVGNTFTLNLPTVMYHRGNGGNNGLTLVTAIEEKLLNSGDSNFTVKYHDLTDLNGFVVGRVFNDLKLAVITDQEILAAISLKSNRNWTLPEIKNVYVNAEETGEDFYFTYQLLSGVADSPNVYDTQRSLGFGTALHCQHLNKVDAKKLKSLEFGFSQEDFRFMRDASTIGTSYGSGFSANKFILLMQRVPKGEQPVHDRWYAYDYTPYLRSDYGTWSTKAIPVSALTDPTHRITEAMYETALLDNRYSLEYLETDGGGNQQLMTEDFQVDPGGEPGEEPAPDPEPNPPTPNNPPRATPFTLQVGCDSNGGYVDVTVPDTYDDSKCTIVVYTNPERTSPWTSADNVPVNVAHRLAILQDNTNYYLTITGNYNYESSPSIISDTCNVPPPPPPKVATPYSVNKGCTGEGAYIEVYVPSTKGDGTYSVSLYSDSTRSTLLHTVSGVGTDQFQRFTGLQSSYTYYLTVKGNYNNAVNFNETTTNCNTEGCTYRYREDQTITLREVFSEQDSVGSGLYTREAWILDTSDGVVTRYFSKDESYVNGPPPDTYTALGTVVFSYCSDTTLREYVSDGYMSYTTRDVANSEYCCLLTLYESYKTHTAYCQGPEVQYKEYTATGYGESTVSQADADAEAQADAEAKTAALLAADGGCKFEVTRSHTAECRTQDGYDYKSATASGVGVHSDYATAEQMAVTNATNAANAQLGTCEYKVTRSHMAECRTEDGYDYKSATASGVGIHSDFATAEQMAVTNATNAANAQLGTCEYKVTRSHTAECRTQDGYAYKSATASGIGIHASYATAEQMAVTNATNAANAQLGACEYYRTSTKTATCVDTNGATLTFTGNGAAQHTNAAQAQALADNAAQADADTQRNANGSCVSQWTSIKNYVLTCEEEDGYVFKDYTSSATYTSNISRADADAQASAIAEETAWDKYTLEGGCQLREYACDDERVILNTGTAYPGFTFGEESVLLGNVSVTCRAIAYRSRFVAQLGVGEFDTSNNPTWESGDSVYITEIGIYDSDNNLVLMGKTNFPIEKKSSNVVVITLDMDF